MSAPDVLVVGAGVFGASVAFELARRGARVTILEADRPGRATSASAGGLWPLGESLGLGCGVIFHREHGAEHEDGPQPLPRHFMDFLSASHERFDTLADELREATGIDVEAEPGTGLLYLLYDEAQERHAGAILDWLGADPSRAERWSPEQVWRRDPKVTRDLRGAVFFPGDHQLNPMLLAEAFKAGAVRHQARLEVETPVTAVELEGDRIVALRCGSRRYAAGAVVNAAGAWAAEVARLAGRSIPLVPVRGQMVCTEALQDQSLCSNFSTADCYLLQKAHGEVIIGSTTEHVGFDTRVTLSAMTELARGAVRAIPALAGAQVKRSWAGLRPGTPDEYPILGPDDRIQNLYYATGGFRTGIVSSPLAGEIVAAAVLGHEAPVDPAPFLCSRFATSAAS